jgi:hypothetical protein
MRILVFTIFLFAATSQAFAAAPVDTVILNQLKAFRDAVYHRDKQATKQFVQLPMPAANALWYMIEGQLDSKSGASLKQLQESDGPMTEKLFDLYYDQLFHKQFVNSFLKLKTMELFTKGEAETPELQDGPTNLYRMSADYDAGEETITLNVNGHSTDKSVTEEGGGEYAYIYTFKILDGHLKLTNVSMAG